MGVALARRHAPLAFLTRHISALVAERRRLLSAWKRSGRARTRTCGTCGACGARCGEADEAGGDGGGCGPFSSCAHPARQTTRCVHVRTVALTLARISPPCAALVIVIAGVCGGIGRGASGEGETTEAERTKRERDAHQHRARGPHRLHSDSAASAPRAYRLQTNSLWFLIENGPIKSNSCGRLARFAPWRRFTSCC